MVLSHAEELDLSLSKHSASRRIWPHCQRYCTEGNTFLQRIHMELNPHLSTYAHIYSVQTYLNPHTVYSHRIQCCTDTHIRNLDYTVCLLVIQIHRLEFLALWSFFIFSLALYFCVKQRPAKSSTWSGWIIWSVFFRDKKHLWYYSFIYALSCKIAKWAINIKALWAFNHSKHL